MRDTHRKCLVLPVLLLGFGAPTMARSQAASPCDVLGRGILSEERSFSVEKIRKSNLTYLCENSSMTLEEAQSLGWKVGFVVEGIPIEMLFDADQKKREEAHKQICSTVDQQKDRLSLTDSISYVPNTAVASLYAQCVATWNATGGQLAAYFIPPIDRTDLVYQVFYAKTLAIPDPKLTRADVIGGTSPVLKDSAGKSVVGKSIRPGASTFTIKRVANSEVRVILETDQGQKVPVMTIPPVHIDVDMRFDVHGHKVTDERWLVYQLQDERNCGNDLLSYSRPWSLGPYERFANPFTFSHYVHSRNCSGSSDVTGVTRTSESAARIDYQMVGCGYGLFNTCKGRGWLNASVTAAAEDLDPAISNIFSERLPAEIQTLPGSHGFFLKSGLSDTARVKAIEWTLSIAYPVLSNGALVKRGVMLTKNQSHAQDEEANLCFFAKEDTAGSVLLTITDLRNLHCDDRLPDAIRFLRETDPCKRGDNGMPILENPDLANPAPAGCAPSRK